PVQTCPPSPPPPSTPHVPHPLSLHDALPILAHAGRDTGGSQFFLTFRQTPNLNGLHTCFGRVIEGMDVLPKLQRRDPQAASPPRDRKSTRLNSSHLVISYAVFCLKKKKNIKT